MSTIAINGASDDLVEIEVNGRAWDELSEPKHFTILGGSKGLEVSIEHDGKRGWVLSTVLIDETEEGDLPFRASIVQEHYSPKLVIEHDRPITVTWFEGEEKRPKTEVFR